VRLTPLPQPNRLASVRGAFRAMPSRIDSSFDELPTEIAQAFGVRP